MHESNYKKLYLLPGLDGTGELFKPLLKELPGECIYEIISYPPDQQQTFKQHVEHVESKLPLNKRIILLAESFSGPIAVKIVKSGKFAIERVIFVATFAKSPLPTLLGMAKHLPLSSILKIPLPNLLVRHFCFGMGATNKQIESFKIVLAGVAPEVLAERLRILAAVDSREELKEIKIPCCYIQAGNDRLVPSSALTDFEKGIKNLIIHKVHGPHFILQAEPKACVEAIYKEAT